MWLFLFLCVILNTFKCFFIVFYVCVCLHVCVPHVCYMCAWCPQRPEEHVDLQELELQMLGTSTWVLGANLDSSGRAGNAVDH